MDGILAACCLVLGVYISWLLIWAFTSDRRVYDENFAVVPEACQKIRRDDIVNVTHSSQANDCLAFCEEHALGSPLSVLPALSLFRDSTGVHRMCMKARVWLNTEWVRSPPAHLCIPLIYYFLGFVVAWWRLASKPYTVDEGGGVLVAASPEAPFKNPGVFSSAVKRLGYVGFAKYAWDLHRTTLDSYTDMNMLLVFIGNGQPAFAIGLAAAVWTSAYEDPFQARLFEESYMSLRFGQRTRNLNELVNSEGMSAAASSVITIIGFMRLHPTCTLAVPDAINLVVSIISSLWLGMPGARSASMHAALQDLVGGELDDDAMKAVPAVVKYYMPVLVSSTLLPIFAGLHQGSPALVVVSAITVGISYYAQRKQFRFECLFVWLPMSLWFFFELVSLSGLVNMSAQVAALHLFDEAGGGHVETGGRVVAMVQLASCCMSLVAWLVLVTLWTPSHRWAQEEWYIRSFSERAVIASVSRTMAAGSLGSQYAVSAVMHP